MIIVWAIIQIGLKKDKQHQHKSYYSANLSLNSFYFFIKNIRTTLIEKILYFKLTSNSYIKLSIPRPFLEFCETLIDILKSL